MMFFQKVKCILGFHDYRLTRGHPISKMGFHVRVCLCCEYAQARELDVPWYEIPKADQLKGYQVPPVHRR